MNIEISKAKTVTLPEADGSIITSYDQLPVVMRVKDIAKVLDIGVGTVYELCRSGELPCRRIGARGQFRVTRSDLVKYIEGDNFTI